MSYVDAYHISLLNLGSNRPAYLNPENLFYIYDQGVPGFRERMINIISELNQYPAGHELYAKLSEALKGRKIGVCPVLHSKAYYLFGKIFFPLQTSKLYFCCIQCKVFERSDAAIFAHESIHALHELENSRLTFLRSVTPAHSFSNMEERKTILGFCGYDSLSICENAFLIQMGFALRLGHQGFVINFKDPLLSVYMLGKFDLMTTLASQMNPSDLKKSVDRLIQCPEERDLLEFLVQVDTLIYPDRSYLLDALSTLPPDEKATYFYWLAKADFQRVNSEGKDIHLLLLEQLDTEECRIFLQKEIDERKVNLDLFLKRASELGVHFRTEWDPFF